MPDHAHLIIRKHKDQAEDMIDNLPKGVAWLWAEKDSEAMVIRFGLVAVGVFSWTILTTSGGQFGISRIIPSWKGCPPSVGTS